MGSSTIQESAQWAKPWAAKQSLMCRKRYIVFTVCSIAMLRGRKLWSAQLYQVLLTTHVYLSQTSDNDRYV